MKTGWRAVYTAVLSGVASVMAAQADVTGSYDGQMTGKKIPQPLNAAASMSQVGGLLTGTVALDGAAPAGGAYLVSGMATPKKVKLAGGNPNGAIIKWTGKIVGTTIQGKVKVKGAAKLKGTLALVLNPPLGDGSSCDAVYTANSGVFTTQVLGRALIPCTTCHIPGGQASATRLRITTGDPLATARSIAPFVDSADPASSRIVQKPMGALPHGGGQQIFAGSPEAQALLDWVTLIAQAHCN